MVSMAVVLWPMLLVLAFFALLALAYYAYLFRPLDYSLKKNWCFRPEHEERLVDGKPADCFLICPTVAKGEGGSLFADPKNPKYLKRFRGALMQMRGIYDPQCALYAPLYRQITFAGFRKRDYCDILRISYLDVEAAFYYYLQHSDPSRPLLIAGFSQGSALALMLVKEYLSKPQFADRFVALYAIGWRITEADLEECPHLKPAQRSDDLSVVVAYNSEDVSVDDSLMVPRDMKTYAINPLSWRTDCALADKTLHKGACFVGFQGEVKEEIPHFCSCYIDEKRGTLKVLGLDAQKYSNKLFPVGVYHLNDFMFFYRNLQENVGVRIKAFMSVPRNRAQ